ncbi:MAG: hypothetical protein ACJAT4_002850 [Granulosicoccus sp.]|jgi:hypothetical protein
MTEYIALDDFSMYPEDNILYLMDRQKDKNNK